MKNILILSIFFYSVASIALVNMESRDYSQSWTDLKYFSETRKYQVGSNGVFGTNWCSILDMRGKCSFKSQNKNDLKKLNLKFIVKNKQVTEVHQGVDVYKIKYSKGLVSEINLDNQALASFIYEDKKLIYARNEWKSTYYYEYSPSNHLTKVSFPDKGNIQIFYNEKNEVIKFVDKDGCIESYSYDGDSNYLISNATKKCKEKTIVTSKYEIWKTNKLTSRVKTTKNGNVRDITYNKNLDPLKIIQDKEILVFEYNKDGSLKSKENGVYKIEYSYKNKKIDLVKEINLKNNKSQSIKYMHEKENIIAATSSSGQSIFLSYYNDGKIKTIADQTGDLVNIEYNKEINKPSRITYEGVGMINVSYNNDKSISKIHSPLNSSDQMKVSSKLNNLLELLSYANINL